ncbi:hypothetical protein GGR51DRAFT_502744 [Nemania sp. FL0031]|nr:hypothetical protein GGR51DRAFT_502744 [Nemania sp. FL0031]
MMLRAARGFPLVVSFSPRASGFCGDRPLTALPSYLSTTEEQAWSTWRCERVSSGVGCREPDTTYNSSVNSAYVNRYDSTNNYVGSLTNVRWGQEVFTDGGGGEI